MSLLKAMRYIARSTARRSAWCLLAIPLLAASCSSTSTVSDNEVTPGDYPNFSKPLTSAMDQMSDDQAKAQQARLSSLAAKRRSGAISEAEYRRRIEEMRKLTQPAATQPTGT